MSQFSPVAGQTIVQIIDVLSIVALKKVDSFRYYSVKIKWTVFYKSLLSFAAMIPERIDGIPVFLYAAFLMAS